MSVAHTPGPWEAWESWVSTKLGRYWSVSAPDRGEYADENELVILATDLSAADARLIASAPELLNALKDIDERLRKCFAEPITAAEAYDSFYQEIVAAALAKAENK